MSGTDTARNVSQADLQQLKAMLARTATAPAAVAAKPKRGPIYSR